MEKGAREAVLNNCLVCGISYHLTPIELRERVSVPASLLPLALQSLISRPGVQECMILSTCNRTEIYLSAEEWLDGRELFCRFIQDVQGYDIAGDREQVYVRRGIEAIRHSFRVASSLDSLVLGEPQILGQFKSAFREAENQGCVDRELHRWIPRVFGAAKQVRSETGICDAAVSISYAAVQLARKVFEDLAGRSVVLLGAGRMSELAALHLKEAGASKIVVANRTLARAEEVAARCSGTALEFERREEQIAAADVVICSTDAPDYVIVREDLRRIVKGRTERPILLLDISVPRNVDPTAGELEGVYLFNIDDLESVVAANRRDRETAARQAELILNKALEQFLHEEKRSHAAPAIAAIRNQVHSICLAELDRLTQRMPELSEQERKALETMLHRIAQKILHPAIMELKIADIDESARIDRSSIEELFGVHRETSAC